MAGEDEAWIADQLQAFGGRAGLPALAAVHAASVGWSVAESEAALLERLLSSSLFVRRDGAWLLTRNCLQGAYFRQTPSADDLVHGTLALANTELGMIAAAAGSDAAIAWRPVGSDAKDTQSFFPAGRPVMSGLETYFRQTGFELGDDLIIHVRDATAPLLVFDRMSRLDRDEGAIGRRNARLMAVAIAVLESETSVECAAAGAWVGLARLLRQLPTRFDFRRGPPPDAFCQRLLLQDNRFTVSADGAWVRPSYFHQDRTARHYLARLASPLEALEAFCEEFPPEGPAERSLAIAHLETLWRQTPRAELGGLTPAQAEVNQAKIVPFSRHHGGRPNREPGTD